MNLRKVRSLFLDSAPIIYFVEKHPTYLPLLIPFFSAIDQNKIQVVTSPITLAECLVHPLKIGDLDLATSFEKLIVHRNNTFFAATNPIIAKQAADIRAHYGLKLPDSIQIATAIFMKCDLLITNDVDFKRVKEITIVVVEDLN
jgi:predicted nucleic acid-binding protein